MLKAKNIIYGFCTFTTPQKNKYLISLYRNHELHVVAIFPTSKRRSGNSIPQHDKNYRNEQIVSYVFKANRVIGTKLDNAEDFAFPLDTTIPFDYCFKEGEERCILNSFQSPQVVGILSDKEYIELVYAFYKSPLTPKKYLPIFQEILENYHSNMNSR